MSHTLMIMELDGMLYFSAIKAYLHAREMRRHMLISSHMHVPCELLFTDSIICAANDIEMSSMCHAELIGALDAHVDLTSHFWQSFEASSCSDPGHAVVNLPCD